MIRLLLLVPVLLSLTTCSLPDSSSITVESFFSPSLSQSRDYTVILPHRYSRSERYALLLLLHGYGGTHQDWVSRTSVADIARELPLIIVMPDAGNSWYVNSMTRSSDRFEDFIITDLRRHILDRFPVDSTRIGIAGLSMGGYGAVMLGLKHPDVFRFAGSLSGALSVPRDIDEREKNTWGRHNVTNLKETFGSEPGPFRDDHDPLLLAGRTRPDRLPFFYLVMGTQDGFETFLPAHRIFTDSLRSYGAAYEYHETPGGHSWVFWNHHIGPLVQRMMEVVE